MHRRHLVVLGFVLALGWVSWGAGKTRASGRSSSESTTPLRTLWSVAVEGMPGSFLSWVMPTRCDADGNVYLLLVEPQGSGASQSRAARPLDPTQRRIARIGADGHASYLDPVAFGGADKIQTSSIALDPRGGLLLLVWAPGGDPHGRQYVVSVDGSGLFRSRVPLDPEAISASQLEVFGSGELLLLGHSTRWDGERVAVFRPGLGGRLRDVMGLPAYDASRRVSPASAVKYVARAGSGLIYFASGQDTSVHVIEAVGYSRPAFDLAPMPDSHKLVGLSADGPRLAATYYEETPFYDETPATKGATGGRHWVAVYDLRQGERVATYGPLPGSPLCYAYSGGEDRLTVLQGGNRLTTLGTLLLQASVRD